MPIHLEIPVSSPNHAFFSYPSYDGRSYFDNTYDRNLSFPPNYCSPRSPIKLQDSFYKTDEGDDFTDSACYKPDDKVVVSQGFYGFRKKRVSFADDKGLKLVEVHEIPGPPKWADDVLTLLIGNTKRSVVKEKKWRIAFDHPPWSDEDLINVLETNMVVLEHISVKEGMDDYVTGAIKVKNVGFEKNIFLRVTFDRWLSHVDIPCNFMGSSETSTKPNAYDTFSFNFKILQVAIRYEVIEFSVCFRCYGKEYWDNNGGINYRIIAECSKSAVPDIYKSNAPTQCYSEAVNLISNAVGSVNKMDSWTNLMREDWQTFW